MSTRHLAQKMRALFDAIGMEDVPFDFRPHGPFALIAHSGVLFVIHDHDAAAFDRWEVDRQLSELKAKPEQIHAMTPTQFLAYIVTDKLYIGFHDSMGFAIKWPDLRDSGFLGLGKDRPNYRRIQAAMTAAGLTTED